MGYNPAIFNNNIRRGKHTHSPNAHKVVPPCRGREDGRELRAVGVGAPWHGPDGPTPVLWALLSNVVIDE